MKWIQEERQQGRGGEDDQRAGQKDKSAKAQDCIQVDNAKEAFDQLMEGLHSYSSTLINVQVCASQEGQEAQTNPCQE